MIPLAPLPLPPFQPAPIPAIFPKDPVDPVVAAEQEKIRQELDSRLARWSGPAEKLSTPVEKESGIPGSGWWLDDLGPSGVNHDWQSMAFDILSKLRRYKDVYGARPADNLDIIPENARVPYISFNHPISLRTIEAALSSGAFIAPKYFDMEMMRLFERARRWFGANPRDTLSYGQTIALQRLYHALTSTYESPNVPYTNTMPPLPLPSASSHSFIPAGPGLARPTPDSGKHNYEAYEFTGLRIVTKDRTATSEARWKGMGYKTGDYVHLVNPEDPSRPIIGQIFRSFVPAKGPKQHWITVCWYYRPEQTWHNPMQMFYDKEICKTGIMVEHPVEDIIERVGCQFYTKYARGRPQAGEWYPGWPLYICNSRYNEDRRGEERGNHFVKIKNWGSCVPEELRKTNFMQIVEFERTPHHLRMDPSPFLRGLSMGVRGIPGGISWDVKIEGQDDGTSGSGGVKMTSSVGNERDPVDEGSDSKRPRLMGPGAGAALMGEMSLAGAMALAGGVGPNVAGSSNVSTPGAGRSRDASLVPPTVGSMSPAPIPVVQPGMAVVPRVETGGAPTAITPHAGPASRGRPSNNNTPSRTSTNVPPAQHSPAPMKPLGPPIPLPAGSLIHAKTLPDLYGSVDALNRWCDVEALPLQTGSLFERDPQSNKVLWFSGPPIDIDQPEAPSHSAKYLTFLARRKLGDQAGSTTTTATTMTAAGKREDSLVDGEEKGLQEGGLWGKEKELEELLYGSV